jgi:hypothetical protein
MSHILLLRLACQRIIKVKFRLLKVYVPIFSAILTDLSDECLTSFALKNYGPQTFNKNKTYFIALNNIHIC